MTSQVLEYAANGSLDSFMKKNWDDITTEHRLSMCMDLGENDADYYL